MIGAVAGRDAAGSSAEPRAVRPWRIPIPSPAARGLGGGWRTIFRTHRLSRNVGGRPLKRDADEQPAGPCRGCGGRYFRVPVGWHNALRARCQPARSGAGRPLSTG